MLTFFEYLRQRAFESILAGASEALDFLEREQALEERPKELPSRDGSDDLEQTKPPRIREDNKSKGAKASDKSKSVNAKEDSIPSPRTKGQSVADGKSKK